MGRPRARAEAHFQPINATPTTLEIGGEGGLPPPEVQEHMRLLVERYPHLHHMPVRELEDLAKRLRKDDEAAE